MKKSNCCLSSVIENDDGKQTTYTCRACKEPCELLKEINTGKTKNDIYTIIIKKKGEEQEVSRDYYLNSVSDGDGVYDEILSSMKDTLDKSKDYKF